MFLQVSVILFNGGRGIPACIAGLQAHTRGGGEGVEGSCNFLHVKVTFHISDTETSTNYLV